MFSNNPNYKLLSRVDQIFFEGDKSIEVFESEKVSQVERCAAAAVVVSKDEKRFVSKLLVEFKRDKEAYDILNGIQSQFLIKFVDSYVYNDDKYFYTINLNEVSFFLH